MILEHDIRFGKQLDIDGLDYAAVLFDLDVTLWPDKVRGEYLLLLKNRGLDWDKLNEFCENKKSEKGYYTMIEVFEHVDLDFMEFLKEHEQLIRPYPDVIPTLDALRLYDIQIGLVTDECREAAKFKLEKLDLPEPDYFQAVEDAQSMKPDPRSLKLAMSRMNVKSNRTLHVADLIRDVKASDAAGVDSALILRSSWPDRDRLHAPTFYTNDLRDIFSISAPSFENYTTEQREGDLKYLFEEINRTLDAHPEGGARFFNNMDHVIKTDARIARLVLHETQRHFPKTEVIVLSGEIGQGIWAFAPNFAEIVTVEGNLRHEAEIHNITRLDRKKVTFTDDSFYRGRTANKVMQWSIRQGGVYQGTLATYDGSWPGKRDMDCEIGLFKYRNHYNQNGTKFKPQVDLATEASKVYEEV